MAVRFDLDLDELRGYRPAIDEPADFVAFWTSTLAESRASSTALLVDPAPTPLTQFEVHDLTFSGYLGEPIRGWFVQPIGAAGAPRPTVIEYAGYGGGRGLPHERLWWPAAGYAYAFMDTRGQASMWGTGGSTADPHGTGPSSPGFMTRGIEDPAGYYYRRVLTDAVLFVDAVRSLPGVDASRVAVTGTSQGGGIALAVAGLQRDLVAVMPDVPFLCHFRRAVGMTEAFPYQEIVQYLGAHRSHVDRTFRTLSYFDGVSFARRAHAPALFSTALMDDVCPPSTVFAAANGYAGEMEIEVYPFNRHEGGLGAHWMRQVSWLEEVLKRS